MKTNHSLISQPFSLRDRVGNSLNLKCADLSWDEEDGDVMSCQMTFEMDYATYQQASLSEMFNHEAELRVADFGEDLDSDSPVELEVILDDECLDDLLAKANTVDEAAKYFLELDPADSPLLATENWYLLYVKQYGDDSDPEDTEAEIIYRTHWAAGDSEDEIDTNELFAQLIEFFDDEDWEYELLEEHGIIKLGYKGSSGEWDCYARASDLETEIGFYSIYPETIPEPVRPNVSEFLTRINYGMPVGNFEMDLDAGEVRFKFSVILGSLAIDFDMLGSNIDLNVAIADRFFPFIKKIATGDISVMEAIARSEDLDFIPD